MVSADPKLSNLERRTCSKNISPATAINSTVQAIEENAKSLANTMTGSKNNAPTI